MESYITVSGESAGEYSEKRSRFIATARHTATEEQAAGLVNINTASREELCNLSGIGSGKAESIINYRMENGNFHTIEEIMNVEGIKDGLFQKIKDKITV